MIESASNSASDDNADRIRIRDLEVWWVIGLTDAERSRPQRLLITLDIFHDVSTASGTDEISHTIDYSTVAKRLQSFGQGRSWKLIETLANDLARFVLDEFHPRRVTIEIEKFVVPNAHSVSVRLTRSKA